MSENKESDVATRDSARRRRRRNTCLYRAANTAVALVAVLLSAWLLRISQDGGCAFLRWGAAAFVGEAQVVVGGKKRSSLQAYDYMFVRKIWDNACAAGMKLVSVKG